MPVHPMPPSAFELEEEARYLAEYRAGLRAEARANAKAQGRLLARGPIVLLPTCSRGHLMDWSAPQGRWVCLPCRADRKRRSRRTTPRPEIPHLGESVRVGHTMRRRSRGGYRG